jgi:hypothetical protein
MGGVVVSSEVIVHIERGIVRGFDPATWRATVELAGAHTALLEGVPVAADLGPDLLAAGSRVWVCLSGEGNPADGALLVPYGGVPAPWVTSRLWKPALVTAEQLSPVACTSTAFVTIAGLSVTLSLEVTSRVLLLLAATGRLVQSGITYTLSFFHDDAHEATQLLPAESAGGAGAGANQSWCLAWLALQSGIAPGVHTFRLKHRVSAGEAAFERGRVVALAMGE